MNKPELIVMLTHNDQTVKNAIEIFESAKDAPAKYWGMKDAGLEEEKMVALFAKMKACGKTTCLEIVAQDRQAEMDGVLLGLRCGADIITGTHYSEKIHNVLEKAGKKYMPFVGKTVGIPVVIEGTIEEIIEEARDLTENKGVFGVDVAPYRYNGDVEKLNREFAKAIHAPCCVAGSINNFQRVQEMIDYGYWAFTVGSAFFEGKFGASSFAEQIANVVSYIKENA